jgi:DNA gyrase/topoisomerase IV subunit B
MLKMPPKKTSKQTPTVVEIKDNETYQAMEPKEHILALPDTYIGGIEPSTIESIWVCNSENEFVNKDIKVSLGFHNIFNEVLTNASDQCLRTREYEKKDKTVQTTKTIKITINKESGVISVYNDGDGIPVVEHEEKKIMVPELVFGQLLTSSNYNKEQKKTWGGKNGLGAKVCNIYSTMFEVETVDHRRSKKFKQIWRNNMSEPEKKAKITDFKGKAYTKITFLPEYSRFGMPNGLDDDIIDLIRKRVYDIAGVSPRDVTVYFNEDKIEVKDFPQYVDKYIGKQKDGVSRVYEKPNEFWEVVACVSPDGNHRQVSIVNGICTMNGGKHVDYVSNKICKDLVKKLNGKAKTGGIKTNHVKNNLWVFINSLIVNPSFSSQTKETLTTPSNKFGSTCDLSESFINKLAKTEIAERAKLMKSFHDKSGLTKTDGKKTINIRGIPKLDDANWAGTSKSPECTLILTEGDSAKALIISGLSVVGRDKYGVFPLRGKLLNVRDSSDKQITGNAELQNLKKILGLQQNTTNIKDLRYGKVLIITDQDSVLGDTPLLLKENNGIIHIKTIDDLTTDWKMDINGKEYGNSNYQVWTDAGWTSIKHVMRHKVTKKIFRVLTHTGIVDVTEDHSLLNKNKEKISPKNCEVNQELLHHFPSFIENKIDIPDELNNLKVRELWKYASKINIQYYQKKSKDKLIKELTFYKNKNNIHLSLNTDYQITAEEAYVIGLWWADGTSGTYKWVYNHKRADRPKAYDFNRTTYNWNITNTNLDFLNKAKIIIEKYYDLEFKIIEDRHGHDTYGHKIIYKLIINGGIKTKDIVDKYSTLFYDNARNKRIPPEILNSNINVREQFFQGYYDGDGCKYSLERSGSMFFDINGKIGAQGLFFLCRSLGYEVSININPNKPKIYVLTITKGKQQDNPIRIKKIIDLGITEQYVYDLETDNHHFQAGVGQLIVHNTDGSHIKGLLMNMFEHYWANLLKEGFLVTMYTPIIKVGKGKKVVKVFYTQNEYNIWKDINSLKGLTVKYYKGLGTSTKEEAKEYFTSLNIVDYTWCENSKDSIDLAFNKKKANKRKKWLSFYDQNDVINPLDKKITFKDFVDKDLIHFSNYDNHRSIPSIDGFKPSQRKAIYTFLKKNITSEMKVAQVTGLITAETSYHHGETSMEGTIVGMAQNFVGSNNINLLYPSGMFGTRMAGGSDSAQSRYIFTNLEKVAKLIFRKEDDPLLTNLVEEGSVIEPKFFMPVIPMILVNGAHGIGTGFSTHVPCFNPKDIISNIRLMLEDKQIKPLSPWYRHFKGKISQRKEKGVKKWYTEGKWEFKSPTSLEITELPIGVWTDDYHHYLEDLIIETSEKDPKKKKKQCITSYKKCNDHDDEKIHLIISFSRDTLSELKGNLTKLKKTLKLEESKSCSVTNLHLFDPLGEIVKFNSPNAILRSYYKIRLPYYKKRREYQIKFLQREIKYLTAKIRFVQGIIDETIIISKRPNEDILVELRDKHHLPPDPLNDDLVISPINDEVYKKALEGEVTRYCYNAESSDDEDEDEDDEGDEDEDSSDSDSSEDSSDSDDEKLENTTVGVNGASPYSTEDEKSVSSLVFEEKHEEVVETREVKKILSEDYGYLLTMHIWSLTQEKLNELEATCNKKKQDLDYMQKITPKELWKLDLDELEKEL